MGLHLRLVAVKTSRQHSMAFILLFAFSVSGGTEAQTDTVWDFVDKVH